MRLLTAWALSSLSARDALHATRQNSKHCGLLLTKAMEAASGELNAKHATIVSTLFSNKSPSCQILAATNITPFRIIKDEHYCFTN
ncbi:MAG: hypothetical protein AAF711_11395 [Planctomycetota bacterium]